MCVLFKFCFQSFIRQDDHFTLVELRAVEMEHIDKEIIYRLAFIGSEVVSLIGKMHIAYLFFRTIESIDGL